MVISYTVTQNVVFSRRIANEIIGEYYCERVAQLIRVALKRCVDNAEGLLNRDEEAVKAVFEGLVITGIAMCFAFRWY